MKCVYVLNNMVREIIPDYAIPPEEWYGDEFASHCLMVPDNVECLWVYNSDTDEWGPDTDTKPVSVDRITELQLAIAELAEIVLGGGS